MNREFWASKPAQDLVGDINCKVRRYFEAMSEIGLLARLRLQYNLYYMRDPDSGVDVSQLSVGTRKRPKINLQLPELRGNVRKQLAFIRQEKTEFVAVAAAGGQESVIGSKYAEKALNYVYHRNVTPQIHPFAERAFAYGCAGMHTRWHMKMGDDIQAPVIQQTPIGPQPVMRVDEQTGMQVPVYQRMKSGAPYCEPLDPTMMAFDPVVGLRANWVVAFERTNVFALAAALEDDSVLDVIDYDPFYMYRLQPDSIKAYGKNDGDVVVGHFYYADSPELPDGRYTMFIGNRVVYDVPRCPLRSGRLPVRVLSTSQYTDCAFSFAESFGLGAIDQALSKIRSSEANYVARSSKLRMWRGNATKPDIDENQNDELSTWVGGDAEPRFIATPPMSPSTGELKEDLQSSVGRLSGYSDVSAGMGGTTSGQHVREYEHITSRNLSLPSSQLLDFEVELANDILELLRNSSSPGFKAEIAGPGDKIGARFFTPDDFSSVDRFAAKAVPEAARSAIARIGLVELVMQIPDPVERTKAMSFILRNDSSYGENPESQHNLVQLENERLVSGDAPVQALISQNHRFHIFEHNSEADRLMLSANPDMQALLRISEHVKEHTTQLRAQDPLIAEAMGYAPPPLLPGNQMFMFMAQQQQAQMMLGMGAPPPLPEETGEATDE